MLHSHFREISREFIPESVFGMLVTKGYRNMLLCYSKREPEGESSRFL